MAAKNSMRHCLSVFLLLGVSLALAPQARWKSRQQAAEESSSSRRTFLTTAVATAGAAFLTVRPALAAIPMVTTDEFNVILRDSARSIDVVEFSGGKSENVVVKLVDGTSFGIKDVIESPTDPRSPLKISAACRENKVPTRFLDLEAMLASAPKKKKAYTNPRVQEAERKEKEKALRMQQDEELRLAELARMEQK